MKTNSVKHSPNHFLLLFREAVQCPHPGILSTMLCSTDNLRIISQVSDDFSLTGYLILWPSVTAVLSP